MSWIVVPNWDRFQHYSDREPVWIKVYTELVDRDDWRDLTHAARGLLLGIWVVYARARGVLATSSLQARLGQRVEQRTLDSLVEAGFVEVSASKPLALTRARAHAKREEEEKNPQTPADAGATNQRITKKDLRRYTGCRLTHGTHGTGYVRDPLGMDKPPTDWPYPEPTLEDVTRALATERKVTS